MAKARFFTVDRRGSLSTGQVISLSKPDISPTELSQHAYALFPAGVSNHGNAHFLSAGASGQGLNFNIDLIFEYVRRSEFPHRPSRYQSVFAWETQSEAEAFRNKSIDTAAAPIFEVECDDHFRCDMGLLTIGAAILCISYNASLYWKGDPAIGGDATPVWEHLLTPPVRVLSQVA